MRAFRTEVVLVSRLPPDEVVQALDALVAERRFVWPPWERIEKPFQGQLRGRRFEIGRVSSLWRAGVLPLIDGAIEPREGGSLVRLRFRSAWHPAAGGLWIAALAIPALLALNAMWTIGVPDPFLLLVVGVGVAGWWATTRGFGREVRTATELLAPIGAPEQRDSRSIVRES